jgi:hypothetical protein
MDPEAASRCAMARQVCDGLVRSLGDAVAPNGRQVECQDLAGKWRASVRSLLVNVAEAERHDIFIFDQGAAFFDVGQISGPRPVASARSMEAASPFGLASGL